MRRCFYIFTIVMFASCAGHACADFMGSLDGIVFTPAIKIGYQSMGCTINIPNFPTSSALSTELYNRGPLDLSLKNANVWVGEIDLNAGVGRISALFSAEAGAPTNITLETQQEPFWGGLFKVRWQGSQFQYSSFDGRAAYELHPGISLAAGFKARKWSVNLKGPIDPLGIIQSYHNIFGDDYTADFSAKTYIPYLGIGADGLNFKVSLLFSPIAWVDAKVPFRYLFVDIVPFRFGYEDDRYILKKNGLFLEFAADTDFNVRPGVKCSLWIKGNWLRIKGNGKQDYRNQLVLSGVPTAQFSDSSSATGIFISHSLSGGIAVEGTF